MAQKIRQRLLILGTTAAYLLIGLEVLFMITPFALFFYGVYGPILEWLSASPATAWTVEFFLPHMIFVDDPLLVGLSYLQVLFVIGLVLFFANAIPLYWGRLTGKGVVTAGLYARIRHPQYLFLAISGLGLLLYWPRFIVLLLFITMLFVYYLLARNEEWRMQKEQPGSYEAYMGRTWMFLPGEPGGRLYRGLCGWIGPKWLGLLFAYCLALGLSTLAGFGLRAYALERLPGVNLPEVGLVSVYPRPAEDLQTLYAATLQAPEVSAGLAERPAQVVYLMPGDFFLTGLLLAEGPRFSEAQMKRYPHLRETQEKGHRGGLVKFFRLGYKFFQTIGTTRRVYDVERLVFAEARDLEGRPVPPEDAFDIGVQRIPVLVVDLDFETREVLAVFPVSGEHAWGKLPMPIL